jgi:photosynthetic reaction center cytochrome c subunit
MMDFRRWLSAAGLLAAVVALTACERPPVDSVQSGYRGTGMVQVYNPRTLAQQIPGNQPPEASPPASDAGPRAREVFKNVQVLGDLSVGAFTRHMTAITAWVAPNEGCAYCHNLAEMSDDSKYTKVVARRMLQMTQDINANWKSHVAGTGVTCYTCHRGNNVPAAYWTQAVPQDKRSDFIGNLNQSNAPAKTVAYATLPNDPFTSYLANKGLAKTIKVGADTALPTGHVASIQATEGTYGLMMHMSDSLGVNCTYCHNTRNFGNWEESSPKRTTAWHGIRMVGGMNETYLDPLAPVFPAHRKGPMGDVAKVNCATCHQGAFKPLYGAAMAKDFPELLKTVAVSAPVAAAVAVQPAASDAWRTVLYFDVGSPALKPGQAAALARVVGSLKATPTAQAVISGYHSASGTLAQNQELAKRRAFAVRDALSAQGIEPARVVLEKPRQTEANVAGEDQNARRVEVAVK